MAYLPSPTNMYSRWIQDQAKLSCNTMDHNGGEERLYLIQLQSSFAYQGRAGTVSYR